MSTSTTPKEGRRASGKFGKHADNKREVLMEILQSPELCLLFRHYLHSVYSSETLTFLLELEDYKSLTHEQDKLARAKEIFDTYLAPSSVFELAVDASVKDSIEHLLFTGDSSAGLFDSAELEVFHIIETELLPKFLQSKAYTSALKGDTNSRSFFGKKKNKISLKNMEKTKSLELMHRFQAKEEHLIGRTEKDRSITLPYLPSISSSLSSSSLPSPKEDTSRVQGFLNLALPASAQGFLSYTKDKDIEKMDRSPAHSSKSKKGATSERKHKDKHRDHLSDEPVDLLTLAPLSSSNSSPSVFSGDKKKKKNRKTLAPLDGHASTLAFMKLILDDYQTIQQIPTAYIKTYPFVTLLCEEEIQHSRNSEDLFAAIIDIFNYKSFNSFLELIEYRLAFELSCAESPESKAVVLREESVLTKLVSKFFNLRGSSYLSSITNPLISIIVSSHASLEVSPERIKPGEDLQENVNRIVKLAHDLFTNSLCMQIDLLPMELKQICFVVRKVVERVCPDLIQRIIGNLFFLRFICPSLVTAKKHNGELISKETRRALVLLSKMLQNLVTGVEFDGTKESYMVALNCFIKDNKQSMSHFIEKLSEGEDKLKSPKLGLPKSKGLDSSLNTIKETLLLHQERVWDKLLEQPHVWPKLKFFFIKGFEKLEFEASLV